jgi:type VI secretion system protein ImpG
MSEREELLQFYRDELTYLRQMGREFKAQHPKMAARLELSDEECADPHVERLIESFAFLTARLQLRLRDEFPEITTALLGALYPQLSNPIPAMAIAQFKVDPKQGKPTTGQVILPHSSLFIETPQKLTCRFRTCYPVTLWPLEVASARMIDPAEVDFLSSETDVASVLRLEVGGVPGGKVKDLPLDRLRFYLGGDASVVSTLYELLFSCVGKVAVLHGTSPNEKPVYLKSGSIRPVGFGLDEEVLPYPSNAHPGYRLLQEYFTFPRKFHFFDLENLPHLGASGKLELYFLFTERPAAKLALTRETFALGCTPVINLFDKTTEPIRLDHRSLEYLLVADKRRESTTEIHSIKSVSAASDVNKPIQKFEPFYSYNHFMDVQQHRAFWHATRRISNRRDMPGTETYLSFLDRNFKPTDAPAQTVYAHTLCTNRFLTRTLPENASPLHLEDVLPGYVISLVGRPSRPLPPSLGGLTAWQLVSHLSLNYLSLSEGSDSLNALREILGLYSVADRSSTHDQIMGITQMVVAKKSMYVGEAAWKGFCRGTSVTLTFDEAAYLGSSAFLLGAVLNHFFGLYTAVNSFTQLTIRKAAQPEEVWKQWEPRAADAALAGKPHEGSWKQWEPMVGEKKIL